MFSQLTKSKGLLATFLHQVQQVPDKNAIIYQGQAVTYAEFSNKVNRLANLLKFSYGEILAKANKPVLIGVKCFSKLEALYAEFAILTLGAAFVPFCVDIPENRQVYMREKANISLMLTDYNLPGQKYINYTACNITTLLSSDIVFDATLSIHELPTDPAYVLFTSGSTAQNPKGVLRSRGALLNQMVRDYKNDISLSRNDIVLNLAKFDHDQAIDDCFVALLNGCTLCLYDSTNLAINDLHLFMKEHAVTVFSSIPSMFQMIFEKINDKNTFPKLRVVTVGGEETLLEHAYLYQRTCPDTCLFINGYGATEMSWISSYTITKRTDLSKFTTIPLGQPSRYVSIKLISFADDENHEWYELGVSGDGLASGYLHDDEANKLAFFNDDENIYYLTGDIVSIENNLLHFQGRKIWHEKISGKRVNLHAVENTIKNVIEGESCVVLAYGEGEKRKLYAFYAYQINNTDLQKINSTLKYLLLPHEIPRLLPIKKLPTLPNGKINREELRKILKLHINISDEDKQIFQEMQQSSNPNFVIEGFWRELLDIPIAVHLNEHSFQTLGGNSQTAIQLANKINQYFLNKHGVSLEISSLTLLNTPYQAFVDHVLNTYENICKGLIDKKTQLMWQTNVDVYFRGQLGSLGYDLKNNADFTRVQAIQYDYTVLKALFAKACQLYNIQIRLGETKEQRTQIIKEFIENPDGPSQVGFPLFPINKTDAHPITSVLCRSKKTQDVFLLVADSWQGFYTLYRGRLLKAGGFFSELLKEFPQLKICFDLTGKQVDAVSCYTDCYLSTVAALQCDMLNESTFLSATLKSASMLSSNYCQAYKVQDILCDKLASCSLFISPIHTFYHAQTLLIPYFLNIIYSDETKPLIEKLTKLQEEKNLNKNLLLKIPYQQLIKISCNTMIWDVTFNFKKLIDLPDIKPAIQPEKVNDLQQTINLPVQMMLLPPPVVIPNVIEAEPVHAMSEMIKSICQII